MNYEELYNETKRVNISQVETLSTFYEHIFLKLSFVCTPIFIKHHVSANAISYSMLLIGVVSAVLIAIGGSYSLSFGFLLYFFTQVLDAVDGNIARMTNTSTFYGRFLDGLTDLLLLWFLILAFIFVIFYHTNNVVLMWIGIVAIAITPFHHLFYDRYSAFARWLNEENQMNVKPYIKRTLSPKINRLINDMSYTCLVAIPVFYSLGNMMWEYFLGVFLTIQIVAGSYYILIHTKYAHACMKVPAARK